MSGNSRNGFDDSDDIWGKDDSSSSWNDDSTSDFEEHATAALTSEMNGLPFNRLEAYSLYFGTGPKFAVFSMSA